MDDERIGTPGELTRFFEEAFTPAEAWKIGMEFEKLGVHPETGVALPYSGPDGVEDLLRRLSERYGWEPGGEAGRVLELSRGGSRITLEPGSQLELSGAPHRSLHDMAEENEAHIEEVKSVSDPLRQAWLGIGNQPLSTWKEIELLPKQRYDIMTRYLPSKGDLGLAMMRETAASQLNLDYESEEDAMDKFRLSMAMSPLVTALFANSCISGGRPNGFRSRRAFIWQNTDPDRCGFIERLYEEDAGFADYVEYALDVPMLFLRRDDVWIGVDGAITFRRYMEAGYDGHRATWRDWILHLSSIFTEARFKPYLEVRGADCPLPGLVMAFPALAKGILYDEQARAEAWDILRSWSPLQRKALYVTISRRGPDATVQGRPAHEPIRDLVRAAREGLKRQDVRNARGEDESVFLDPLEARLEEGWTCPAKEVLDRWDGEWGGRLDRLIAFCRF